MSGLRLENSLFIVPFLLALLLAFSNGYRDSSTIVATIVSTRVLSPNKAFFLCAVFEFIGSLFLGSAIVATVTGQLFGAGAHEHIFMVLVAALLAALAWGLVAWWRAWPTSNNQSLVASLFGAGVAAWGSAYLSNRTFLVMMGILLVSPLIGFVISMAITRLLLFAGQWMTPRVRPIVDAFHLVGCLMVASAHGTNGGQMVMGVILSAVSLGAAGAAIAGNAPVEAPLSFRVLVATTLAGGVLLGGRRLLAKLGMKFYRIRPTQAVSAQGSAAGTILACALTGFPASTTQVIASSILGAGVASNPGAVRWHIAQDIMMAWVFTLPAAFALGYLICGGLLRAQG